MDCSDDIQCLEETINKESEDDAEILNIIKEINDMNKNTNMNNFSNNIENIIENKNCDISDSLTEVIIDNTSSSDLETIVLKKPNQVYYEIYKRARKKAKDAKKLAIISFIEAKNIKKTYMLDNLDSSDSEDSDMDMDMDMDI